MDRLHLPNHPIKSGRLTKGQRFALTHYQQYMIDAKTLETTTLDSHFQSSWPILCEIGFGHGQHLIAQAQQFPETNFLGIDIYSPGIGATLAAIHQQGLQNVKLCFADARFVLTHLPPATLAQIEVHFPDPWPKKKHHKRRLVNQDFLITTAKCLSRGGGLIITTDAPEYANEIDLCLQQTLIQSYFSPHPNQWPVVHTKYAAKAEASGSNIRQFCLLRQID